MIHVANSRNGLTVKAYRGDGATLLAFDLDERQTDNLAGFQIDRTTPSGATQPLLNRLAFTVGYTKDTTAQDRKWTASSDAPLQKFRWLDYPPSIEDGKYQYTVTARYFAKNFDSKNPKFTSGASAAVEIDLTDDPYTNFDLGFTRGYLSSQAYADKFKNAPIRPAPPKTMDFDATPFSKQYEWLGYSARKMIFNFLDEIRRDHNAAADVFAYDLDEPDFIRALAGLKGRIRVFLDNAALHTGAAVEVQSLAFLRQELGDNNVKFGHFKRFAHNKVIIKKNKQIGGATKVLGGSANFSVRGLYVQANNVMIFNDPKVANWYEQAFETAFNNPNGLTAFINAPVSKQWYDFPHEPGVPPVSVSFSPHKKSTISLQRVADAVKNAQSSVLFAIMDVGSKVGGVAAKEIQRLSKRHDVFSFGISQNAGAIEFFNPGNSANRKSATFAALDKNVPAPFTKEWSGGAGQTIHHKFVVVDFNDQHPTVFAGSSNLAGGGEEANGDNLVQFNDPAITTMYAVEAIRLVDHYQFRVVMKDATKKKPFTLQGPDAPSKWWEKYYDEKTAQYNERLLLCH